MNIRRTGRNHHALADWMSHFDRTIVSGRVLATIAGCLLIAAASGCSDDSAQHNGVDASVDAAASDDDAVVDDTGTGADAQGNPCDGIDCSGHGTCTIIAGEATCTCEAGYHADQLTCIADAVNPYLEPVEIPTYDETDPTHVLITETNGKWDSAVLNNPSYKHFYIEPGAYDPAITLTVSGTEGDRRTLSLYNGDDVHPAALSDDQVANCVVHFSDGASYWVLDRIANLDRGINPSMSFRNGASHNIVNRWHLRWFLYGVAIGPDCNNNTIQNSYIDQMVKLGQEYDCIGLDIHAHGDQYASVIGTKFINNDIRNATDSIQTTRMTENGSDKVNFEGTIIDSNRMWVDNDVYTDSEGNYDPDGEYQIAENGLDLKAGSENPSNPMIITNNIMWGYRTSPFDAQNRTGTAFVSHFGVRNVIFASNIIFDSGGAMAVMGSYDWEITNNIFCDTNFVNPADTGHMSMLYISENQRIVLENNTLVRNALNSSGSGQALNVHQLADDDQFLNNLFIDTLRTGGDFTGHVFDNNWFYHATETLPGSNEHHFDSAAEAVTADDTFTYERFTANPKQKILKGVVSTPASPHFGLAGSNIEAP